MENNLFLGLAHIGIFTENFEETLEFYTKQLPFEIVKQTIEYKEDNPKGMFPMMFGLLRLNDLYLEVMECANHYSGKGAAGVFDHLGISVRNLDDAIVMLKENGITDGRFGNITVDSDLIPGKSFRQCRVRGYNGEMIGLYEVDNTTFYTD